MKTRFIDADAFAQANGLPLQDLRRWINEGRIPALRLGRTLLIPEDAFERMLGTPSPAGPAAPDSCAKGGQS